MWCHSCMGPAACRPQSDALQMTTQLCSCQLLPGTGISALLASEQKLQGPARQWVPASAQCAWDMLQEASRAQATAP